MFICKSCNLEKDNLSVLVIPKWGEPTNKYCSDCRTPRGGVSDIYFKGAYVDEHLGSEEFPGPKQINSRADKKYWLDKCNLREAGDRHHGASSFDKISNRHAMASLEKPRR